MRRENETGYDAQCNGWREGEMVVVNEQAEYCTVL